MVSRFDGHGHPAAAPTKAGQVSIDNDGRVYVAADVVVTHDSGPSVTSVEYSNSDWTLWNNVHAGDHHPQGVRDNVNHFYFNSTYHNFYQRVGTTVIQVTWAEALQNVVAAGLAVPAAVADRDYLGAFQDEDLAARTLARQVSTDPADWVYILEGLPQSLRRVTAFSAGNITRTDQLHWVQSPVAFLTDVDWMSLGGKDAARPSRTDLVDADSETPQLWAPVDVSAAIDVHDFAKIGPYHYEINQDATQVDSQAAHFLGGIFQNETNRPYRVTQAIVPVHPSGAGGNTQYGVYVWKVDKVSDTSYMTRTGAADSDNMHTTRNGPNIAFTVPRGDLVTLHAYSRVEVIIQPGEFYVVAVDRTVNGTTANTIVAAGADEDEDFTDLATYIGKASFAGVFGTAAVEVYHNSNFAEKMRLVIEFEEPATIVGSVGGPTQYYWGVGQSERVPRTYPNTGPTGTASNINQILDFAADGPHEVFRGGSSLGNIMVPAADVSANIDSGLVPALTDNMVFSPPAGIYHVYGVVAFPTNEYTHLFGLKRIIIGVDEDIEGEVGSFASVQSPVSNRPQGAGNKLDIYELIVEDGDQFYWWLYAVDEGDTSRMYFRIEKVG